jgi:hypothetical protein
MGRKLVNGRVRRRFLRAWAEQADQNLFRPFGFDLRLRRFFLNFFPNALALSPDGQFLAAGFVRGENSLVAMASSNQSLMLGSQQVIEVPDTLRH